MFYFQYVPNDFGVGLMVPIPKGSASNSKNNTDDYRGISINPVISKVFEHCLLELFSKFLTTSEMQFGFKSKVSCNHAIYAVRKTIEFFIERSSTVNIASIDLEKAFDKMNRYALFIKLLQRDCPTVLIGLLDCCFSKVVACVKWGSCVSSIVKIISGTRQGGVVSPTLFAVFINDVLVKLEKSGLRCFIKNICFNAFMYA